MLKTHSVYFCFRLQVGLKKKFDRFKNILSMQLTDADMVNFCYVMRETMELLKIRRIFFAHHSVLSGCAENELGQLGLLQQCRSRFGCKL